MFLLKQQKLLNLIFLKCNRRMHKAQSMMASQRWIACQVIWVVNWSSPFVLPPLTAPQKRAFLLGRTSHRYLWLFRLSFGDPANVLKWIMWACHLEENNWQHLLSKIIKNRIWTFKLKLAFWKTWICYHELGRFSMPKDFLIKLVVTLTDVIFLS